MDAACCAQWRLPPGISLRPTVDADLPFLRQVYASTRWEELQPTPWTTEQKLVFLSQQFALQHHHYQTYYPNTEYLLILQQGVEIGRIYVQRLGSEIALMDIALLPAHRNQGIGSALLAELVAEADRSGSRIGLYVERDNPAQRLYARFGFEPVEDGDVYQFLRRVPTALS